MTKLTLAEQRRLMRALPRHRIELARQHCRACEMKGEGVIDILKSVGKILGPVIKEVGPTVLKEFVLPFVKRKVEQRIAQGPGGKGLKLAGQGRRKKK